MSSPNPDSNSTLSLYQRCPPGLGDAGCLEAACNSTFVEPGLRTLKPSNATSCPSCDAGFTGLNCNICQGVRSCSTRQAQANRGLTGITESNRVGTSGMIGASLNNTLTCNNQPYAIDATYLQCNVNQPTLSALFPGSISLTGIKVVNAPNFTSTGMGQWSAPSNSSFLSLWLDGVEQFYCQATSCHSSNTTTAVNQATARWGTEIWSCDSFSCFCPETTRICANPTFPLSSIINQLSGSLDFPCDYVDPNDPNASSHCTLSTAQLNQFVGPQGLALGECSYGQCVSQFDLDQSWQQSTLAAQNSKGDNLSNGVIAGLAILGVAVAALIFTICFGYWLRRKAMQKPRTEDQGALGMEWNGLCYRVDVSNEKKPRWLLGKGTKDTAEDWGLPRDNVEARRATELDTNAEIHELRDVDVRTSDSEKGAQRLSAGGSNPRKRTILHEASSKAKPGSLNYIIGPSGAGKSSLVDILAGRPKRGSVTGTMAWVEFQTDSIAERVPFSQAEHMGGSLWTHRKVALVDQDDSVCLPGYLSVYEALSFAAELSLPENVTKEERTAIIDDLLDTLGLFEIRHSRIGDSRSRGISGGERRRLTLAIAMVGRPKVLIADECTSGLDSFSALRVIKALRRLASGSQSGTTIIATLHQPSSQIFHMADNVVLLSNGRTLFDGPPSSALGFCQRSNVPIPPGHNVADHLLAFAFNKQEGIFDGTRKSEPSSIFQDRSSSANGQEEQTRKGDTGEIVGGGIEHHPDISTPDATKSNIGLIPEEGRQRAIPLSLHHGGGKPVTTFITQLHALVGRSILMTQRDLLGAAAHIVGSAVVSVFVGGCFYQVKLNLGGFQNRVGSMFFIFILLMFSALSAIIGLSNVRSLMMRERANALYSPWSWVASHLLHDLVLLRAVPALLIVCIVYWMVGLSHSASSFFLFVLIAVLYAWTMAMYNMLLAALIDDTGTAILLAVLYVLFNIFMAGFLMSLNSMPSAVRWLRWIVPTKYALEAVASNELKGLQFVDTFAGVPVRTDVALFSNSLFGFEDNSYYRNLIVLGCGFLVGFGAMLFSAVWWRMRELR